jgi:biopolymer transport protein ExbD
MAGSSSIGEENDNPVAINVTAMVDVIFCLCLFFMCSFHFKQLEGKIETWLPKQSGVVASSAADKIILEDIRIILQWDDRTGATARRLGGLPPANSDSELMSAVVKMSSDYIKLGRKDFPVLLDVARDVPWKDVVHVMDILKKEKLERIEFTAPPAVASSLLKGGNK